MVFHEDSQIELTWENELLYGHSRKFCTSFWVPTEFASWKNFKYSDFLSFPILKLSRLNEFWVEATCEFKWVRNLWVREYFNELKEFSANEERSLIEVWSERSAKKLPVTICGIEKGQLENFKLPNQN